MRSHPLVSIIIPSYNYAKYIEQTIVSAQQQSFRNIEIIVIDDGSVDDTRDIVIALLEKDERIKYHYQNNQGLSAARNAGLNLSLGDYIQFLDADDLISKDKIEIQVAHFTKDKTLGISYCSAFYFKGNDVEHRYLSLELKNEEWMPKLVGDNYATWIELVKNNIMPVNAALVKRDVIKQSGQFNIALKSLEDWDYWLRCAVFSRICYVDSKNAYALIRVHPNSMSQNKARMYQVEIELRAGLNAILVSLPLSAMQKNHLIKENNKRAKRLISRIIGKGNFFNGKLLNAMAQLTSKFLVLKAYVKAINDLRKN